ncbi:hypothetical protein LZ005_16500 [Massilia sp. TS11]|nr:hypothetical protein [Massilia sp. TS11]
MVFIEESGITPSELATRLACSPAWLSAFLAGEVPVTSELAQKLERALGPSAAMWLKIQADYLAWQGAPV